MKKHNLPLKYGIGTGLVLIFYFLVLSAVNLTTSPIYSIVNALICGVGVFFAINKLNNLREFSYQEGFGIGFLTGFYATLVFTIFFGIYSLYHASFAKSLVAELGLDLNSGMLVFVEAFLGLLSALIVTPIVLLIFKSSWKVENPT